MTTRIVYFDENRVELVRLILVVAGAEFEERKKTRKYLKFRYLARKEWMESKYSKYNQRGFNTVFQNLTKKTDEQIWIKLNSKFPPRDGRAQPRHSGARRQTVRPVHRHRPQPGQGTRIGREKCTRGSAGRELGQADYGFPQ